MVAGGVVDKKCDRLRHLAHDVLVKPSVDLVGGKAAVEAAAHRRLRDPPHAGQPRRFELGDALQKRRHVRLERAWGQHGHIALGDQRVHGRRHERLGGGGDVLATQQCQQGSGLGRLRGDGERADELGLIHHRLDELRGETAGLQRGVEQQLVGTARVAQDGRAGVAHRGRVHVRGQQLRVGVGAPRGGGPANHEDRPLVRQRGVDPGQRVAGSGEHVLVVDVAAPDKARRLADGDKQPRVEAQLLLQVRGRAHPDGAVLVQRDRGVHEHHDQLAHLAHRVQALRRCRLVHRGLVHLVQRGRFERKLPRCDPAHRVTHRPRQPHRVRVHPHQQARCKQLRHRR